MNAPSAETDRCVLVLVRAPRPGRVKTRLEPLLPRGRVASLYRAFVEDLLETIETAGYPLQINYCPANREAMVRRWLGPARRYRAQSGTDLGRRMADAMAAAFGEGYRRVILVGSDLPDLPEAMFHQSFARIESAAAVIGPSTDGGYYLIGFRRESFRPDIFSDIPWGGPRVLEQTLTRMDAAGIGWDLLPPWQDVDVPADLTNLACRLRKHPERARRTAAVLKGLPPADETVVKPDRL